MKQSKLRYFLLSLCISFLLSACGGGGSSRDSDDDGGGDFEAPVIKGKAAKGIVIKGNVTANELNSAGSVLRQVGSAVTGANGNYNLVLTDSYGGGPISLVITNGPDTAMVCDATGGCGTRTDGLTSADDPNNNDDGLIDFGEQYKPANLSMSALIPVANDGATLDAQITPFTNLASARALGVGALSVASITAANSEVSNLIGDIDILRAGVVDITALSGGEDPTTVAYAALNASILEIAMDDMNGQPDISDVLNALSNQFSNGTMTVTELQAILDQAVAALTRVGAVDTSGALGKIQNAVDNAVGGVVDPKPNPNAGNTDVEQAKAFIADLRTWGTVIGNELDSPSEAFSDQVDMATRLDDFFDEYPETMAFKAAGRVIRDVIENGLRADTALAARQCGRGNAIAFDDTGINHTLGTLFWANETEIARLDPATGRIIGNPVGLDFSAFGYADFRVVAMDFHPLSGELYAAVQQGQASTIPQPRSTLGILDPLTGSFTRIGTIDGSGEKLDGIAFTSTGVLYGTSTGFGTGENSSGGSGGGTGGGTGPGQFSQLRMVDITTGMTTEISPDIGYGGDVGGLAINSSNVLFAGTGGRGPNAAGRSESTSALFTIDPATGLGNAAIGPLGIEFGPPESDGQGPGAGNFDQFGSRRQNIAGWSFDPVSENLYGMTGRGSQLFIADTATGLATRVGTPCDSINYYDFPVNGGTFTGLVSMSSTGGQSTYTVSNAEYTDQFGSSAKLHLVASGPDQGSNVTNLTLEISSAVADGYIQRLIVQSGSIDAVLNSVLPIDYIIGTPHPVVESLTLDLDFASIWKTTFDEALFLIETSGDPISFVGDVTTTVYTYIDPVSGESEEGIPGSLTLSGVVGNTTGDSLGLTFSFSNPTAAADALNPAVTGEDFEFYDENNPFVGSFGLQFEARFDGLPAAEISITGNATDFEQGNGAVTISYDLRSLKIDVTTDPVTGDTAQVEITNQSGAVLLIDGDAFVDDDDNNDIGNITINSRVVGTVDEFGDGATRVSYIDGSFEIF